MTEKSLLMSLNFIKRARTKRSLLKGRIKNVRIQVSLQDPEASVTPQVEDSRNKLLIIHC